MPYWFDGNNLIGQSSSVAAADDSMRCAFLKRLGEHAAHRRNRFVVYFDGDDRDRTVPPRGVQVRYSAPLSTDDAIVRALAGQKAPSEVIVVTNDRALTSSCREAGAKTMSWHEFSLKMESTPAVKCDHPNEKVELKDWIRYFGLDEESLE